MDRYAEVCEHWKVGDVVYIYPPTWGGRGLPSGEAPIEKIYKNGNLVVKGVRYSGGRWEAAYETGDGYARGMICQKTPELAAKIARELAERAKTAKLRDLSAWLATTTDPDALPPNVVRELYTLKAESKGRVEK